jgi:hypothetical protein
MAVVEGGAEAQQEGLRSRACALTENADAFLAEEAATGQLAQVLSG